MYSNNEIVEKRKNFVFLVISGIFLSTLGLLNILGISRFVDLSFHIGSLHVPMIVPIGVLPYPVTFLCTDLVSELYGRTKANQLVVVGLLVNVWVMFILWLGGALPGLEAIDSTSGVILKDIAGRVPVYFEVQKLAFGAVIASMIAYICSQFCDVYLFHFWKSLTKGKYLWLRNNASTLASQLIDTSAVVLITYYYANALPLVGEEPIISQLLTFVFSSYLFKFIVALCDTVPFYLLVGFLSKYFRQSP